MNENQLPLVCGDASESLTLACSRRIVGPGMPGLTVLAALPLWPEGVKTPLSFSDYYYVEYVNLIPSIHTGSASRQAVHLLKLTVN